MDFKPTRPETMAVIFAEILGKMSVIVSQDEAPNSRIERAEIALDKAWNAVEHFIRSLACMGCIALTAGNMAYLKRAWLQNDPEGRTFKERIGQMMKGAL